MSMTSVRERLTRLETKQRFLRWMLTTRLFTGLTRDENEAFIRDRTLPAQPTTRLRGVEGLDQKTLLNLWQEQEKIFVGRREEELKYFSETGLWTEHRGRFEYSTHDGNLVIKWCKDAEAEEIARQRLEQ
jgi:hypothetical protein